MTVDVHLFSVGHCRNSAWFVESGPFFQQLHLPAMVAVIRHPEAGVILFDTGYGKPLVNATSLPARLYRALLPFRFKEEDSIPYHLWSLGLSLDNISTIFLSHFHPDHIGSLKELLDVDCELDGIAGRSRPQVVQASLEALLPPMEVHGGHLCEVRIGHVNVQALRLANVGTTSYGKVDKALLWDLPDSFVELLDVRGDDLDLLD
jgi:glyoxylase-like metal-dependent hydrolase (beta-lactamase superfamily II)